MTMPAYEGRNLADLETRAVDAEIRIDRAKEVLSQFLDDIGDAPFALVEVVTRALNELDPE